DNMVGRWERFAVLRAGDYRSVAVCPEARCFDVEMEAVHLARDSQAGGTAQVLSVMRKTWGWLEGRWRKPGGGERAPGREGGVAGEAPPLEGVAKDGLPGWSEGKAFPSWQEKSRPCGRPATIRRRLVLLRVLRAEARRFSSARCLRPSQGGEGHRV